MTNNVELFRQCFDCNFNLGLLTWKARPLWHFKSVKAGAAWNKRYAGTEAGFFSERPLQRRVRINGLKYQIARIVWALHHSVEAKSFVFHIDKNSANCALSNLSEDQVALKSDGLPPGVYYKKAARRYEVVINKVRYGTYATLDEAALYYATFRKEFKHADKNFRRLSTPDRSH